MDILAQARDIWIQIRIDIEKGVKLEEHLTDLKKIIEDLDSKILARENVGLSASGYTDLKNEIYFLIHLIKEKQ